VYAALVYPPSSYTWRRFKSAASVCSLKLLVHAPLRPYALTPLSYTWRRCKSAAAFCAASAFSY
jgi:hypothetical protein